jgi:hypothetical protein
MHVNFVQKLCYVAYNVTYLLTELSPSWEAANCAATHELPSILRNPKVHYTVHKSPPLVPILCQIDPVYIIPSYLSKTILILSTHLRLSLHSDVFPSGFPTNVTGQINSCREVLSSNLGWVTDYPDWGLSLHSVPPGKLWDHTWN